MVCEFCGALDSKAVQSMTSYHFTGEKNSKEDPNRDLELCGDCEADYVDYWTCMWNEVRGNY